MKTNEKDIIQLCREYIDGICFAAKLTSLAGCSLYCSASNDRAEIHEAICEYFGFEHSDKEMLDITNNLDKAIGLDVDCTYTQEEINDFARKLYEKLNSIRRT